LKIYLPRVEKTSELPEAGPARLNYPAALKPFCLWKMKKWFGRWRRRSLNGAAITVLAAKNVTDALRFAEEGPHAIHLLLTDTIMPVMNGPELANGSGPFDRRQRFCLCPGIRTM